MFIALISVSAVYAQNVTTVTGTVKDETGEVLPGVSILLKGSNGLGTTTESNGAFKISLPAEQTDGVLVFSFIGYKTQEVSIGTRTQIDVALEPDLATLGEVVVVGYGTQEKKDVTGAIASIRQKI